MKEFHGRFPSETGQNIFYRIWKPDGKIKATIQIIHGMAEHSLRYSEFAEFMCKNGYIVAANDHPGHGVSGKDADAIGYFDEKQGWNKVCNDLEKFNQQLKAGYDKPVIIIGHSMGSFFARSMMFRSPKMADKWIL